MARLIYLAIMSLDGSIADADGPTGGRAQAAAIALRDAGAARVAVVVLGHRFDRDFGDGGTYYQQARARNLPGTPVASNRTARRGELLELKVRRRVADGRGKQNRSRVRDSRNHCVLLLGGHCRSGHHPAGGHRALGRRRRTQPQARALRPGRRLHLIASAPRSRRHPVEGATAENHPCSSATGCPRARSPPGGRTRGLAQHSQRGECPKADRGQPDDKAKPSGLPDTRCLERPGQRRVRIPAVPHAQAGEITGHDTERETESNDHHDPLSHVQPVNPAHRPTLAGPSGPRDRICARRRHIARLGS
jgi:hypothetical protein